MAKKKTYVQVGVGGRARFFYSAVAGTYGETSEITAFATSTEPALSSRSNRSLKNSTTPQ